ncbi:MAG: hypothetical protein WBA09_22335 [Candidatus Acidiferrum sp.]
MLYPTFQRGVPNQKPSDTLIQQFIDDTADMIVAILERRFNEAISGIGTLNQYLVSLGLPDITWYPGFPVSAGDIVTDENDPMSAQQAQNSGTTGTNYPAFSSTYGITTTDNAVMWKNIGRSRQLNVLERGNRYGAASQLGAVMASFNVASAAKLAKEYTEADWMPFKSELNAETMKGEPKTYGLFDFLFDPQASVQTPRPLMEGIAGGDQQRGIAADIEGVSAVFSKFGLDYTFRTPSRGWPAPGDTQ